MPPVQSEARAFSLLVVAALCAGAVLPPLESAPIDDTPRAEESCSACSAHPHRDPAPSATEVHERLQQFATEPMNGDSEALEWLLYHGDHVRDFVPTGALDVTRHRFLQDELARDAADVELRIVTADGTVRAHAIGHARLGEKVHLEPTHNDLGLDFGGSVLRVGLHHLWSRF